MQEIGVTGIILGAGKVDPGLAPVFGNIPSSLIPINGKPSIFYILDHFIQNGISRVYISVGFGRDKVLELVSLKYGKKMDLRFIDVDYQTKPGCSLLRLIESAIADGINGTLCANLADTLVEFDQPYRLLAGKDFVVASKNYDLSDRWCVVAGDQIGNVHEIYDKVTGKEGLYALIGFYNFSDACALRRIADELHARESLEISEILTRYIEQGRPLSIVQPKKWYDLGHLDNYYNARLNFLVSRSFNRFQYNSLTGTITKHSKNGAKLRDEILWLLNIPKEISALAPRILSYDMNETDAFVEMEYYGYSPLSELWIYGDLSEQVWKLVISKLMQIVNMLQKYPSRLTIEDYRSMCINKPLERIASAKRGSNILERLFQEDPLIINGKKYSGWPTLEPDFREYCSCIASKADQCLIHGDLCFSNILFDQKSGIIRLIDPRGNWGTSSVYGDIKYDIAKLRHSICGAYDYIINDLFESSVNGNSIRYQLTPMPSYQMKVSSIFDEIVQRRWNLNHIKYLEGSLFLSMLPLHAESQERQLAMFATGITRLNEILPNV